MRLGPTRCQVNAGVSGGHRHGGHGRRRDQHLQPQAPHRQEDGAHGLPQLRYANQMCRVGVGDTVRIVGEDHFLNDLDLDHLLLKIKIIDKDLDQLENQDQDQFHYKNFHFSSCKDMRSM